jgi:sugar phosphate isomerase/epimerase
MLGDGCIDIAGLASAVYAAGFNGDAEIEVLNARLWAGDQDATLRTAVERYLAIPSPG